MKTKKLFRNGIPVAKKIKMDVLTEFRSGFYTLLCTWNVTELLLQE